MNTRLPTRATKGNAKVGVNIFRRVQTSINSRGQIFTLLGRISNLIQLNSYIKTTFGTVQKWS